MNEQPTEQLWVHCGKCHHEWALGWLPMPADSVVVLMKHARCPNGHHSKFLGLGLFPKPTTEGDPIAWLTNGDTGTSSETIWSVLTGRSVRRTGYPLDPSDFGRCYRLLEVMPLWRERLPEVAAKYPEWRQLVEAWDELTELYEEELPSGTCLKLYRRMQALREQLVAADAPRADWAR